MHARFLEKGAVDCSGDAQYGPPPIRATVVIGSVRSVANQCVAGQPGKVIKFTFDPAIALQRRLWYGGERCPFEGCPVDRACCTGTRLQYIGVGIMTLNVNR